MTTTQPLPAATSAPAGRSPTPRRSEPLRAAWRWLTSMRTALLMLFLMALAAVPGSLLPQVRLNPSAVERYRGDHPRLAPLLSRLGLFDVFGAPWFLGLYALVVVALVGCLAPRLRLHWRALRAGPPPAPRRLSRLPEWARWTDGAGPAEVAATAEQMLRRRRWRVTRTALAGGGVAVSAEKGHSREAGNLAFHLALLGLLLGVAWGSLSGYQGSVLVVEGDTFTNTAIAYDRLSPGRLTTAGDLRAFSVTLDDFSATYLDNSQPTSFAARLRYQPSPDSPPRPHEVRVNHPLTIGGARVYLLGHGYAPRFVVRDRDGRVVYDAATPLLPVDQVNYLSTGVVKVPDTGTDSAGRPLPQLGFQAVFYPTVGVDAASGQVFSRFPAAQLPGVSYVAYAGDLGLDDGVPQNVYELDTARLVRTGEGFLFPGQTARGLAGGATLTYEGHREYAVLQVTRDPGKWLVLGSSAVALVGLMLSLRVRRRRFWLRALPVEGRTLVEVGGLARQDGDGYREEFTRLAAAAGAPSTHHRSAEQTSGD